MMEDNAQPLTVKQFPMGADVPEWLLTLEPRSTRSTRKHFRFAMDVDVIETEEVFVVIPRVFGRYQTMLDMTGTTDCDMFAPGKPCRFATTLMDIFARGVVQPIPLGLEPGQWAPGPGPAMAENAQPAPPKLGYWRRVWQALKAS